MEKYSEKRFYWIDIIKIIACLCVIINHASICLLDSINNKFVVLFYSIIFAICKIGVPLFLMVTGYLLLNKPCEIKTTFNRILRILIPLIIISLLFYIRDTGLSSFDILSFFKAFINNSNHYSLWYLYLLIGLYLAIPFIQKMIKNFTDKDYKNFIIIFLLVPGVVLSISSVFDFNLSQDLLNSLFPISIAYVVTSIYLSKINLNKRGKNIALISFVVATLILIMYMYLTYINNGSISYKLDSWMYITTIIPSLSIFYLIRYSLENKKLNNAAKKIIKETSLVTFGIYLFHCIFIEKVYTYKFIKEVFITSPYIAIIMLVIFTFVICGIVTYILKKIPIIKKYL